MPKIVHTARYTGLPLTIMQQACPEEFIVETLAEATYECLRQTVADADYLLVSGRLPIDSGILSAAPHLKMIQRTGVGTEMLDMEAIAKHGIPVYINAGVNARSVAEHTVMLMLATLKRLPQINAQMHQGVWKKQLTGVSTNELYGKTVGLVGMGNIGRSVASMLQPFGVKILYTDVFRLSEIVENQYNMTYYKNMELMLPMVDVLSFHCPLTPDNQEILNKETLPMMKRGAIVVNTARGRLIEPNALYGALLSGQIRAAGLDTHYEEPIKEGYLLAQLDNVILTPHIGGLSYEAFSSMLYGAMENIAAFESGHHQDIEFNRLQ